MDTDRALRDTELAMHSFLDCIIDGDQIDVSNLLLPLSIVDRIKDAIADGRMHGKVELHE